MINFSMDKSGVDGLSSLIKELNVEMNTPVHLTSATSAAGAIMFERFVNDTHVMASARPEAFHHVYEWEHIGDFGWQLFKPVLKGTGGARSISWEWKASKTTVPTETDALGNNKWPAGFDISKLNRVHVFVWKAPIMEYGLEVEVRPKLSPVLVFPNPNRILDLDMNKNAPRDVVFSPHPYTITNPGGPARGEFTKWFIAWFGTTGQKILDEVFAHERDNDFKRIFNQRVKGLPKGKSRTKSASFGVDTQAASQGKTIAALIAGELERNYIAMAAERKRVINGNR